MPACEIHGQQPEVTEISWLASGKYPSFKWLSTQNVHYLGTWNHWELTTYRVAFVFLIVLLTLVGFLVVTMILQDVLVPSATWALQDGGKAYLQMISLCL